MGKNVVVLGGQGKSGELAGVGHRQGIKVRGKALAGVRWYSRKREEVGTLKGKKSCPSNAPQHPVTWWP